MNVGLKIDLCNGLRDLPRLASDVYRRAPASVMTVASVVLSYLVTLAIEDYHLYRALGPGGLGKPSLWTWLVHTLLLRPAALPRRATVDGDCLPLDDPEWQQRLGAHGDGLDGLPRRSESRPMTFGIVPHRQLQAIAPSDGPMQKAVIDHLHKLAQRYPDALTLALSTYEASDSPCLFVRHAEGSSATPTTMARFYLAGTPSPSRALPTQSADGSSETMLPFDATKHELVHIHLSEGSLHMVLSPQDTRKVLAQGWGERHGLAGVLYRGNYVPPFWLPRWCFRQMGGEPTVRWGYQRRLLQKAAQAKDDADRPKGKAPPPTYTCIYAPTDEEQLRWTLRIIDSSVAWALGQPL